MTTYPDTSFLCALYRMQDNSAQAIKHFQKMTEPLHVTAALLYEFRQSIRLQGFLHAQNPHQGFDKRIGDATLHQLQANIAAGAIVVTPADWSDVYNIADRLSSQYTLSRGHRAFDIFHVATALHLGAQEFLTFDANQGKLARSAGLKAALC